MPRATSAMAPTTMMSAQYQGNSSVSIAGAVFSPCGWMISGGGVGVTGSGVGASAAGWLCLVQYLTSPSLGDFQFLTDIVHYLIIQIDPLPNFTDT